MQSKHYEIGKDGKLVEMVSHFDNLPAGSVIEWGGNYGFPQTRFCVLSSSVSSYDGETVYQCYNLDEPDKNSHLHRVEARQIKREDDPGLWHTQHYFITDETLPASDVELRKAHHEELAAAHERREAEQKAEGDRLEALGRELWPALLGDCPAVIVAEKHENDSDGMTDYYASHTSARVILAPSKHKRDIFSEMRKAADILPETAHLGTGKGRFSPYVAIGKNFISHGSCYYEGARSHWHGELDRNERGELNVFTTRAEAEAYTAQKGAPEPISFDGEEVPFLWKVSEEEIEHREKYSMGKGYYLATHTYSGWQVCKDVLYNGGPTRADYICLAKRHDHLKGKPAAKPAPAPQPAPKSTPTEETAPAGYTVTYDRDWTWIQFPGKPSDRVLAALHAADGGFSRRRQAWYFKRHLESGEIAAMVAGTPAPDVLIPTEICLSNEIPTWEMAL